MARSKPGHLFSLAHLRLRVQRRSLHGTWCEEKSRTETERPRSCPNERLELRSAIQSATMPCRILHEASEATRIEKTETSCYAALCVPTHPGTPVDDLGSAVISWMLTPSFGNRAAAWGTYFEEGQRVCGVGRVSSRNATSRGHRSISSIA